MLATRIDATGTSVTSVIAGVEARPHDGALVLAEQLLDAADGDGVGVPGVAGEVGRRCSTRQSWGAWNRWYMLEVSRSVT